MQLDGKIVLVTGGAKRVGAVIVRHLAEKGARVVIHCNTSCAEAEALCASLPETGHKVLSFDLSIPGEAEKLFRAASPLDAVVNNASLYRHGGDYDEPTKKMLYEVNYRSPLALMRLLVQNPPAAGGAVVNVLDQEILSPRARDNTYLESRRLLMAATLEFAKTYGPSNLRFNAVAPGPMLPPAELPRSKMEKTVSTLPLRRRVEPDDLARAVLFLLACDSVTGAVLPVDCGQHL